MKPPRKYYNPRRRKQIAARLSEEHFQTLRARAASDGKTMQDKIEEYIVIGLLVDDECDERAEQRAGHTGLVTRPMSNRCVGLVK
jgi:hypothetical protein